MEYFTKREQLDESNIYLIAANVSKQYNATSSAPSLGTVTAIVKVGNQTVLQNLSTSNSSRQISFNSL